MGIFGNLFNKFHPRETQTSWDYSNYNLLMEISFWCWVTHSLIKWVFSLNRQKIRFDSKKNSNFEPESCKHVFTMIYTECKEKLDLESIQTDHVSKSTLINR